MNIKLQDHASPAGAIETTTSSSNEDFERKMQNEQKKSLQEPLIQKE